MSERTLVFFIDETHILLPMKKRGFGKGKWNGYGGKLEAGETPLQAIIREVREEAGVEITQKDLIPRGKIFFEFLEKPEWNQTVHLYVTHSIPPAIETDEMKPQLFLRKEIPYPEMWDGDEQWIPLILNGKTIDGRIVFGGEGKTKELHFKLLD